MQRLSPLTSNGASHVGRDYRKAADESRDESESVSTIWQLFFADIRHAFKMRIVERKSKMDKDLRVQILSSQFDNFYRDDKFVSLHLQKEGQGKTRLSLALVIRYRWVDEEDTSFLLDHVKNQRSRQFQSRSSFIVCYKGVEILVRND